MLSNGLLLVVAIVSQVAAALQAPSAAAACRTARRAAFSSFGRADLVDAPMHVDGAIPSWLSGTYVRNGPGLFEVGDERRVEHWFDGYAMLLRVSLAGSRPPLLSTKFIASDSHAAVRERGSMACAEFMTPLVPPGGGLGDVLKSFVSLAAGEPTDNACVNIVRRGGRLEAMTETQRSWFEIDPSSLATLRRVEWEGDAVGQLSTAHAQRDPLGGGYINVGTEIAPPLGSCYRIFRLDDEAPHRRQVLATIACADRAAPFWLHAFGLTRRAVVVIEQPAAYSVTAMLGLGSASHGSIDWRAPLGTRVHVLDRSSGVVRTHTLHPAFFFFHVANAFDRPDGSTCLDICAFDSPQIVTALRLDALLDDDDENARDLPESRLQRLTLPAADDDRPPTMAPVDDDASGKFCDLPSIAPSAVGDPAYRYVYTIGAARPTLVSNRLCKVDVTGACPTCIFEREGMLPGEPLFVPRPGASDEDDGVVLSMGTDADGGSSLYVLDASDMSLLARCRSPVALPAGFHGAWLEDCAET